MIEAAVFPTDFAADFRESLIICPLFLDLVWIETLFYSRQARLSRLLQIRATIIPTVPTIHATTLGGMTKAAIRSEEHTSELQSRENLVCRLLLEKKKININTK